MEPEPPFFPVAGADPIWLESAPGPRASGAGAAPKIGGSATPGLKIRERELAEPKKRLLIWRRGKKIYTSTFSFKFSAIFVYYLKPASCISNSIDCEYCLILTVQRMGRTGRKREGRIVALVTEGAEERKYNSSVLSNKLINKVSHMLFVLFKWQSNICF